MSSWFDRAAPRFLSGFQELTLSASLLVEGEEAPDWCAITFLQVQPTLDWLDLCPFLCTSLECDFSTTDVHLQLSARNSGPPVRHFVPTRLQSRFLSFQQQLLDSGDDEGTMGVFADWASDHDLPDLEASLRERLASLHGPSQALVDPIWDSNTFPEADTLEDCSVDLESWFNPEEGSSCS